jgi:hypothetical protein
MAVSSTTTAETSRRPLQAHRREIGAAGQELVRSTRSTLDDITLAWRLQAERNPYLSLGAAFAAGYVLGGGVPLRLVRFAVGTGARMAATMALREALGGSLDLASLYKKPRERNSSERGSDPSEADDSRGEGARRRSAGATTAGARS